MAKKRWLLTDKEYADRSDPKLVSDYGLKVEEINNLKQDIFDYQCDASDLKSSLQDMVRERDALSSMLTHERQKVADLQASAAVAGKITITQTAYDVLVKDHKRVNWMDAHQESQGSGEAHFGIRYDESSSLRDRIDEQMGDRF